MKELKWHELISVNLFWLAISIRNNSVTAIFLPFLVAQFAAPELRNTALGLARTAGLVLAMLVQPAAGILSDRSTSRYGRRRPFIFFGVLFDLLSLALLAASGSYGMLLAALLLVQVSSNTSHGAMNGLMPDLVPENQRGVASGIKSIFDLLPIAVLGVSIAVVVARGQLALAVALVGAALLGLMLLTVLLVKETPLTEKPNLPLKPALLRVLGMLAGIAVGALAGLLLGGALGGLAGLISWSFLGKNAALMVLVGLGGVAAMIVAVIAGVWAGTYATLGSEVRRQPAFTWWVVNRLLYLTAIGAIQFFAVYFIMSMFGESIEDATRLTGRLITVVGVCILLSALPSGWLADRFSQRRLVAFSGLLSVAGVLVLLVTFLQPSMSWIYAAGIPLGIAAGIFSPANWALGTRLIPGEQAGRYLGVSNLAGAGAGIIGAGIGGPIADYLNAFSPNLGYLVVFTAFGLMFLASVVVLKGVKESSNL